MIVYISTQHVASMAYNCNIRSVYVIGMCLEGGDLKLLIGAKLDKNHHNQSGVSFGRNA